MNLTRKFWVLIASAFLALNLSACGGDPEFEAHVKQDWEEAFQKAQLDPCSLEASSIRTTPWYDPRFEKWAAEHPLSDCPPRSGNSGSADCSVTDDEGNYIKRTCDEAIAAIVGDGGSYG
jgi:hypothetical protein